jgi:hypothetical protein
VPVCAVLGDFWHERGVGHFGPEIDCRGDAALNLLAGLRDQWRQEGRLPAQGETQRQQPKGDPAMTVPTLDLIFLITLFGFGGLLHLSGLGFLRAFYRRRRFRSSAPRVIGVLALLAAAFLSIPTTRIEGVIVASLIIFGATVALLNNRKYKHAVPAMLLMAALVPALVAGPL